MLAGFPAAMVSREGENVSREWCGRPAEPLWVRLGSFVVGAAEAELWQDYTHTSYRALTGQGILGISCKFERLILGKICAKLISVSDTLTQNQGDIY